MQGNLNDLLKDLPPELARTVARYGVKLAIDLLETLYTDLAGEAPAGKKRGRPPKVKKEEEPLTVPAKRAAGARSGWPDDPEERRREMARRQEVSKAKKIASKQSAGAKKRWASQSPEQRATWLRAMQRGKKRAAKSDKKEEAAA